MKSELEQVKVELIEYKAWEDEQRAHKKKAFLGSEEFFYLLDSLSAIMFEYDFNGATQ